VPGAACSAQSECQNGTYCDSTHDACLAGTTGSPCESSNNCDGSCTDNVCGCSGIANEQELASGPLDIYFIFDRTSSMGTDCAYVAGETAPVSSKACFATYAMSDYLINVDPIVDTRLAFQFMSYPDGCDGTPYATPLIDLTTLPVTADHQLIQEISDENFAGGSGTQIEGALRGIFEFTSNNVAPGREMIGVLMTDGEPNRCDAVTGAALADLIAAHLDATGIRTFIIGMDEAVDETLEEMGLAGGAEPHDDWCGETPPPCHHWNVGDGSGEAIESALQAIIRQSAPLPCNYGVVSLSPPEGETLDFSKVNVTLTQSGDTTTIGQVQAQASCPSDQPAWYYDDPAAPTEINLCPNACTLVTAAGEGARLNVVVGCETTVRIR
jgi:hypothetical protein